MPFVLILFGAVLLVAGIRNTYKDLWTLVKGDFTEQGGFLTWVAAIAVVGGMGYIPKLKPLSVAFMTLLLLVLVLSNGGVFAQLQKFIQSGAGGNNKSAGGDVLGKVTDTAGDIISKGADIAKIGANLAAFA